MKLLGIIYALIIQLLATQTVAIPTVPIVSEYVTLSKLCNEGAEDTVSPFQTTNLSIKILLPPPLPQLNLFSPFDNNTVRCRSICQRRSQNI